MPRRRSAPRIALALGATAGLVVAAAIALPAKLAVTIALTPVMAAVWAGAAWARSHIRFRPIDRQIVRLERAETREAALASLRGLLAQHRPWDGAHASEAEFYVGCVLHTAHALHAADATREAESFLAELPERWLTPKGRAQYLLAQCLFRLYADDVAGARRSLDALDVDRLAAMGPDYELAARLHDARLLVAEGRPAEALERLGDDAPAPAWPPNIAASALATRAHACAALGELDAARAALRRLRDVGDDEFMRRFLRLRGPASPLMLALDRGPDQPYR